MSSGLRGTSVDQDSRWGNSNKKLMKKMKFAEVLGIKVDTTKVKLDVINKWASERITEILGFEDEIVIGTVINSIEARHPDPKQLQLDITGFLEKKSPIFIEELWTLLTDAQQQKHGIPTVFIETKKAELATKQVGNEQSMPSPLNATKALITVPLIGNKSIVGETSRGADDRPIKRETNRRYHNDGGETRRRRSRSPDRRDHRGDRGHHSYHSSSATDRGSRRRSRSRSR